MLILMLVQVAYLGCCCKSHCRASYAREKAEMAETAAGESREEASKARQRAKELTASLPPRGGY